MAQPVGYRETGAINYPATHSTRNAVGLWSYTA